MRSQCEVQHLLQTYNGADCVPETMVVKQILKSVMGKRRFLEESLHIDRLGK